MLLLTFIVCSFILFFINHSCISLYGRLCKICCNRAAIPAIAATSIPQHYEHNRIRKKELKIAHLYWFWNHNRRNWCSIFSMQDAGWNTTRSTNAGGGKQWQLLPNRVAITRNHHWGLRGRRSRNQWFQSSQAQYKHPNLIQCYQLCKSNYQWSTGAIKSDSSRKPSSKHTMGNKQLPPKQVHKCNNHTKWNKPSLHQ